MSISNSQFQAIIEDIQNNYPEFLRPKQLVATGLYKSVSDVCWSMKRNLSPPWIKVSKHKIVFPRVSLCIWLEEKMTNNALGGQNDNPKA